MAYYAALDSVKLTIEHLLVSPKVSFLRPCQEILQFAYEEVSSVRGVLDRLEQQLLKNSTREEVNALTGQIRDAACKLEDSLESHVSDQVFSQSESLEWGCPPVMLSPDTDEVMQLINYIKELMENLEKMIQELRNPMPEEDGVVSPSIQFGGEESKMVGFSGVFRSTKSLLMHHYEDDKVVGHSIFGMAGIGKSKVAKEIYKDQLDFKHFELCAWVTIGPEHPLKMVLLHDKLHKEGDEISIEDLYIRLKRRKYLIVADDIWSTEDWDKLRSSLPEDYNKSRVLITTRLKEVAFYAATHFCIPMPFLDEEESWDLLRQKVFGEECLCPFQLEKAGRKIAQKCEGIPLTIVKIADILSKCEKVGKKIARKYEHLTRTILTIANILSKSEQMAKYRNEMAEYWNETAAYWNEIAEKKNSVFKDAYEQMSKVLFPSYKYLPLHLKAAFLYMGVFPPNSKIRASKLYRLWIAERFLTSGFEEILYLNGLVSSSVFRVEHQLFREIKSWSLCSPFWYLCTREARKEKFFHVLETYPSSFNESAESQRRFCILNNTLLGIKDVDNSMKSITTVRSLLCTGPEHHYPVPLFTGLKLLRVVDALTIRFYYFPDQVLKLIHLRYLALTYSGKVSASISKLWNLKYLIVRRHMSINKSSKDQSYLPIVIWDMQELKHLQIMGSNLPDPCGGALLPNLLSLLDISVNSCRKEIFERLHMLKKLGVRIELVPDAAEPMYLFDHLSVLEELKSFKCVIVNPNFSRSQIVSPPTHFRTFPVCLKKLSLSGFGYPWECIRVIAQLPKLEVLKLRCYAFQGPEWVTHDGEFENLRFLLLEDTDLVHWKAKPSFYCPRLHRVIIRHCYKLKEVPIFFHDTSYIEVVDCPLIVDSVRQFRKENYPRARDPPIHCSWHEEKPKSRK